MKKQVIELWQVWVKDTKWGTYTKDQRKIAVWFQISAVILVLWMMCVDAMPWWGLLVSGFPVIANFCASAGFAAMFIDIDE